MNFIKTNFAILIISLLILSSKPAFALPGQTETAFKNWANSVPVLKSFAKIKSICGPTVGGTLNKDFKLEGQNTHLTVVFDYGKKIEDFETLSITNPTIAPARNNVSFLSYLSSIFGKQIGTDFERSQDVYTTRTKDNMGEMLWASALRGQKYLYVVAFTPKSKDFEFDIWPLKKMDSTISKIKSGAYFNED